MCGGGCKGPSPAELVVQDNSARDRAKAETDKIEAERATEKQEEATKVIEDQVAIAKQVLDRRQRPRTLLGGFIQEEGASALEDRKAKLPAPGRCAVTDIQATL